jgi:hypothetical protein
MTGFFAHLLPHTPQLKPPVYFFLESSFGHWANIGLGRQGDTRVRRPARAVRNMIVNWCGLTSILAHTCLYALGMSPLWTTVRMTPCINARQQVSHFRSSCHRSSFFTPFSQPLLFREVSKMLKFASKILNIIFLLKYIVISKYLNLPKT